MIIQYWALPRSDVAPEEKLEEVSERPRDEERQMREAAGEDPSPHEPVEAAGRFVRWLPAQAFREVLSRSRFLVQRFVVEELGYGTGNPMNAVMLRKAAG